jgi:hypothetical protein
MKKLLLLLIFIALCILIVSAKADAITSLWVTGAAGNANNAASAADMPADSILWYGKDRKYTLFLPGCANPDAMRIWFTGTDSVTVGSRVVHSGDSAGFLAPGKTVRLQSGKYSYTLDVMRGSGIPALFITTQSGTLDLVHKDKENREPGMLLLMDASGNIGYNGGLSYIKMHGNSSISFKKKNYQIRLAAGTDLLSMGKAKIWIITGNSRDKSLLRNQIALDLAQYAGMAYTPEHCQTDVYINSVYMGCCLFSEKVQIENDRIDIADLEAETEALNDKALNAYDRTGSLSAAKGKWKAFAIENEPEDISGGYLVEFEAYAKRYAQEPSAYMTRREDVLVVKSPEYASPRQMAYISGFFQAFENAIFAGSGIDAGSGKRYDEYVDMESLVLKYLLEEVVKNYDGNTSSMFFYKPADSAGTVAFAGPAWDYDSAFGSYAQEHNKKVLDGSGFWINSANGKYWWPALYRHPEFSSAAAEYYRARFKPALQILLGISPGGPGMRSIAEYRAEIEASAAMNFTRWPMVYSASLVANTGFTYDDNIAYLTRFIKDRYEFLNGQWQ